MQLLRKLLFPFAFLYGTITCLRNNFYDWGILYSKAFDLPVICVGNLNVGGTGKSPMIEYLISLLKKENKVIATLSRGYKRNTKGFYLLKGIENAKKVGDEPLQFKTKFPNINVAVDENRRNGIENLLYLVPKPEVILLDDAFQHRKVKPGFSILLTAYEDLFINDYMLPSGNLREPKRGSKRAQLIVVTKCPSSIAESEISNLQKKIKLHQHQTLYFSTIAYAEKITNGQRKIKLERLPFFTLVTGIAKPEPMVKFLEQKGLKFEHLKFADHHNYSENEIQQLNKKEMIVTTEKDFMRLKSSLSPENLFYLPIKTEILFEKEKFDEEILKFVYSDLRAS